MGKHCINLALIILGFSACSGEPSIEVPEEFRAGQQVFNRVCGTCHGVDMNGNSAVPALIDDRYLPDRFSDGKLRSTIINGSESRIMRPQRGNVSDSETEEIIKYIRYFQKNKNRIQYTSQ